jgi:hypothetical protein
MRGALRRGGPIRVVLGVAGGWFCCHDAALAFDFAAELFGEPSRIAANVVSQDPDTGRVQFNGGAVGLASAPVWEFGDGVCITNWFPAEHTYTILDANYVVTVTGRFTDGATNATQLLVRFGPVAISPVSLPAETRVLIPDTWLALTSRMAGYGFSPTLTCFDESFFTAMLTRAHVEYVLSVAASIQMGYMPTQPFLIDGAFRQVLLRDPAAHGMYSIWYSSPVAFGAADYAFQGSPQYSSFFHEMGHNFSLNFPPDSFFGGKIDGNANAIYSETLAQILQHATACDMVNGADAYGLPEDLVFEIAQSARSSMRVVRKAYDRYLAEGMGFCSWNDPSTPAHDEAFDTFMTLAYKFLAHAERAGRGYQLPTRRLLVLLEPFDADLRQRYDQHHDTPEADAFRATLMVAALSYAHQTNLTAEFAALGFPVSEGTYDELMGRVRADADVDLLPDGWEYTHFGGWTNAVADADVDVDGTSNLAEYVAGTDPTDSASVFAVRDVHQGPAADVVICWSSASNRSYAVEVAPDLPGGFLPETANLPATPPLNVYTTAAPAGIARYFRVSVR